MPATSEPPICARARDARARQSPAAPSLEAQCRAQGGGGVRSIGRINASGTPGGGITPRLTQSAPLLDQKALEKSSAPEPGGFLLFGPQRVPDVVGMPGLKARDTLIAARFKVRVMWLNEPGASMPQDAVRATIPSAGQLEASGIVEIQLPGSTKSAGVGYLYSNDAFGRGFDLDTFRSEDIALGADIVLKNPDGLADGGTLVTGVGNAVVTRIPFTTWNAESACQTALQQAPVPLDIAVKLIGEPNVFGCVRTSRGQMATIRFDFVENPAGRLDHVVHVRLYLPPSPL